MRPWTVLRTSGAWWFLPVVFAIGVWIAVTNIWLRTGYSVEDLSTTSLQVYIVGPMAAGYLAFRMPTFLRTMSDIRPTRGRLAVLLRWWAPIVLGAPVVGVAAMVSAARILPHGTAAWAIVGIAFLAVLGCTCLGALAARALPRVIGVPLVTVGAFVWFAFPDSGSNLLLRNLDSNVAGCCGYSSQPIPGFFIGSGVLDLVVILSGLGIVTSAWWDRRTRLAVAGATVVILGVAVGLGGAAAVAVPGKLDFNSTELRTTALVCSSLAEHQVCVWPEHRTEADGITEDLIQFDHAVTGAGLPPVTALSEHPEAPYPAIVLNLWPQSTDAQLQESLVSGYVARATTCGGKTEARDPTLPEFVVALVVGAFKGGVPSDEYASSQLPAARQVLVDNPGTLLAAWFDEHTCIEHTRPAR